MNGLRHFALRVGLALAAALVIGFVAGQARQCQADDAAATAEDRIRAALETTTQMEFSETPLVDVLEFISSQHGIPVHLNEVALDDEGLSGDTPITFRASDIRLRSALNLMLEPLNLEWLIRDEVLFITTSVISEENLQLRRYPVGDLLSEEGRRRESANGFQTAPSKEELLIRVVKSATSEENWEETGGPGRIYIFDDALVVATTNSTHDKITATLRTLRQSSAAKAADAEHAHEAKVVVYPVVSPADQLRLRILPLLARAEGAAGELLRAGMMETDALSTQLVELISTLVEPGTWNAEDAPGRIAALPGAIVVKHTAGVHEQVREILEPFTLSDATAEPSHGFGRGASRGDRGIASGGGFF